MIRPEEAARMLDAFDELAGEALGDYTLERMMEAFQGCADVAHAKRARQAIMEGHRVDEHASPRFKPCLADVQSAIRITYQEPEQAGRERFRGCRKCDDSGLWSRDVLLPSGVDAGVCGPCPDCARGQERAQMEHQRRAEKAERFKERKVS